MSKPASVFSYIRADEVAETWEGVSEDLYRALWGKIVPLQPEIPNIEDTGPGDHVGHANLALYWHHLTSQEQLTLNILAGRNAQ